MITGGKLFLPCEVGVKTVLPAVRALMARTILEKHGMKEEQAADILNLSQSAVSKYVTRDRGNALVIENVAEVQKLVDKMITLLIQEPDRKMELMELFCQTCRTIREKGLLCQLCRENEDESWRENCNFCRSV